jgi:hypothetical protein
MAKAATGQAGGSEGSVGSGWCSLGGVGSWWCWFALLFCFLNPDSVIQLLEESHKLLELLRDVVRQGEVILDLVVQAPH